MAGQYIDLLNAVSRVIGGSQPDAANQPYWWSGVDSTDSTGVAGLSGCYSLPPDTIGKNMPVALVLPISWKPLDAMPMQGHKFREDLLHVCVLTGHDTLTNQFAALVNFCDTVPTAFDTHMQLFNTTNVLAANCSEAHLMEMAWPAGTVYMAAIFVLRVERGIPVTRVG